MRRLLTTFTLLAAATAAHASITATILDENGKPLPGARARAFAREDTTAAKRRLLSNDAEAKPVATAMSADDGTLSVDVKGTPVVRLVTSVFLHFGIIHLALNMIALWNAGPLVERLFGPVAFADIYLVAGLTGSVASLAVHGNVVSAGASGAIFGLAGVFCLAAAASGSQFGAGTDGPPIMCPCPTCGVEYTASDLRRHRCQTVDRPWPRDWRD